MRREAMNRKPLSRWTARMLGRSLLCLSLTGLVAMPVQAAREAVEHATLDGAVARAAHEIAGLGHAVSASLLSPRCCCRA